MSDMSLRSFIASPRSISLVETGLAVRRNAARGDRRRISPTSSAKSRRCGTAASCSGATRCLPATASAPPISRPISRASWRGATGVFPTGVFNGFGMGALRCADGAFVLGEMGQHTVDRRADLFSLRHARSRRRQRRRGRYIRQRRARTRGGDRSDARRIPRASRTGTASTPDPAVAMIRLLHVDMPGEALRARIEANLALQHRPNYRPSIWCAVRAISRPRCRAL